MGAHDRKSMAGHANDAPPAGDIFATGGMARWDVSKDSQLLMDCDLDRVINFLDIMSEVDHHKRPGAPFADTDMGGPAKRQKGDHHDHLGSVATTTEGMCDLPQIVPQPQRGVAATSGLREREIYLQYECGYCSVAKVSTSSGPRVRIRCECGGKYADKVPRMHAKWTLCTDHGATQTELKQRMQEQWRKMAQTTQEIRRGDSLLHMTGGLNLVAALQAQQQNMLMQLPQLQGAGMEFQGLQAFQMVQQGIQMMQEGMQKLVHGNAGTGSQSQRAPAGDDPSAGCTEDPPGDSDSSGPGASQVSVPPSLSAATVPGSTQQQASSSAPVRPQSGPVTVSTRFETQIHPVGFVEAVEAARASVQRGAAPTSTAPLPPAHAQPWDDPEILNFST